MRKLFAMVAIAFAMLSVNTASASTWECQGPAFACGNGSGSGSAKATKTASHKASKSYASDEGYSSKKSQKAKKSYDYADSGSYSGKASYYWEPQRVASGGWFNPNAMTAAHKTLPFGTKVRVTNRNNGQSVVVTINDRGPYVAGRVIDLSRAAAQSINMTGAGVAPVSITVLGKG